MQLLNADRGGFFTPCVCVCVCTCWWRTQRSCVADRALGFAASMPLVLEHMCLSGETAGKYDPLMSRLHSLPLCRRRLCCTTMATAEGGRTAATFVNESTCAVAPSAVFAAAIIIFLWILEFLRINLVPEINKISVDFSKQACSHTLGNSLVEQEGGGATLRTI